MTSAYHPQSNGLDERFNQTLERALQKTVNEQQDDWDEAIDDILFAYRTSVHATTKYSPFYLMFGRQARLPIEIELDNEAGSNEERGLEQRLEELKTLRQSYGSAADNIVIGQDKQKAYYDKKHGSNKEVMKNVV